LSDQITVTAKHKTQHIYLSYAKSAQARHVSASGQESFKRVHSKAPASLIDNSSAFGLRKASKVEKTSSIGVGLHRCGP